MGCCGRARKVNPKRRPLRLTKGSKIPKENTRRIKGVK